MKIRNGFVSNSSSSSFAIYGICFDDYIEIRDILIEAGIYENTSDENDDDFDFFDLEEYFPEEVEYHMSEDTVWVGVSFSEIGDDETGRQFKERVANLLGPLAKNKKCKYYKETIFN